MNHGIRTFFIAIVTIAAVAVFGVTLTRAVWLAPDSSVYVPDGVVRREVPPEEQPARLLIPALGIDAHIQYVGVNGSGNMGTPSNFTDVAWYKFGTAPGEIGSAAIDGHVDNGLGLAGVFKRLGDLKVGDDVYVTRKNGEKLHFKVYNVVSYPYTDVPLDLIFNKADGRFLNLITCEGTFIKNEKTYDQRLIVYTRLVSS